jgi:hypothetical protein
VVIFLSLNQLPVCAETKDLGASKVEASVYLDRDRSFQNCERLLVSVPSELKDREVSGASLDIGNPLMVSAELHSPFNLYHEDSDDLKYPGFTTYTFCLTKTFQRDAVLRVRYRVPPVVTEDSISFKGGITVVEHQIKDLISDT